MNPVYSREDVRAILEKTLLDMPSVIAAVEGGSAATGYLDRYSDLDLEVVCEDDAVETVIDRITETLAERFGILRMFRVPEPAWHGFSQVFYQVDRVPPLYYIDFAVIKRSIPDKFTETDRHGHAVVWFDKAAVIAETTTSPEQILARGRRLYMTATSTDFLMILEARKGIARDDFAEAFTSYYRFLANHLAILLNLKHRPVKADFGLRYARRDYPKEDSALVETALKVATVAELAASLERLVSRF
ncbi:MAG: hypothetical protein Q8N15_04315, partial [Bacillota bacterium]|nr:hypothetical protein [Bacillota bacterium]